MRQWRIIGACLLLIMMCSAVGAVPQTETNDVQHLLSDGMNFNAVNQFAQQVQNELNIVPPKLSADSAMDFLKNGFQLNGKQLLNNVFKLLFHELNGNLHLLGKLILLAVLCSLLQNLMSSFEHGTTGKLAYSVCFILLMVIAVQVFKNAIAVSQGAIQSMVAFMEALLPLLVTLLAAVGAITSAALFQPLMVFMINTMAVVIRDIVFPLLFFTAMLEIVGYMAEGYKLSNLAGLMKQGSLFILGLGLVVFLGIVAIQGVAGSVTDGVALRTAKYTAGAVLPVVGKMFADAVELVVSASLLLKNIVGLFGVCMVGLLCLYPMIKLVGMVVMIKLAGALVQPLGDARMARCLDGMGNNLLLVFICLLTVTLMFFLSITLMVAAGSVAVMLR